MAKHIKSYKHADQRPHTPSTEEAGMEQANPQVANTQELNLPKNPVVHRGQDPELMWLNKYGEDGRDDLLQVDIRSLYRHEHISPELLINGLYKLKKDKTNNGNPTLFDVFGNTFELDELDKPTSYYTHQDGWSNRIIQGDSLLVMSSLLEREGMAGKVQCIYMDPPYGIKYGSNWQMQLNKRDVKDGSDEYLTGEPEMIKAYRDTWELGIHSYLSYLRDRLLVAKELLTESGSCFVQISDENVHLVRNLMDEVFGSENFISLISFRKTGSQATGFVGVINDYLVFYSKSKELLFNKFKKIYQELNLSDDQDYNQIILADGTIRKEKLTKEERENLSSLPEGSKIFQATSLQSDGRSNNIDYNFEFKGRIYSPNVNSHWKTSISGLKRLAQQGRITKTVKGNTLRYIRYFTDFPFRELNAIWNDTYAPSNKEKEYVVQTSIEVVQRCILMTTDPGDLVLDPTCGSGTTAYVAEQGGRRWITIDTSRIALNIAKTRLMTALFPYYYLYDEVHRGLVVNGAGHANAADIRNGFEYEKVPHVTLKSLANDEPPETETLYDKPRKDNKRIRVSGPFTVETLQNFEPIAPEDLETKDTEATDITGFEQKIFQHLKSAGVKNGLKNETAVFIRIESLASPYLHAEGFYQTGKGERKAYFHIGPQFGTVSRQAVNEAVKECRNRGGADWLIILGFSFESNISNATETTSMGSFEVTKVRMADDLLQEGLLKKDKKAASFMTIGEPDIKLHKNGDTVQVEIAGMDIYDPIRDEVKSFNREDIAYWMVDDDYDGASFIVKQVFFCGGDDEFDKWRKALEKTVKVEIDEEAWERLYKHTSHSISYKKGKKIAVRVISQFGEESTKVLTL
jgi:adenine-specific DNA-methyltransferase